MIYNFNQRGFRANNVSEFIVGSFLNGEKTITESSVILVKPLRN